MQFWKSACSDTIIAVWEFLNAYFHLSVLKNKNKLGDEGNWMLRRKQSFCSFGFFLSIYCGRNSKDGISSFLCDFSTMQRASKRPVFYVNPSEPLDCNLNDAQCL